MPHPLASETDRNSEFDLVSFERPPVAEVALCFQFPQHTIDLDVLALFSERVRADLPVRQLHPVVPPMVERFDALPALPTFEFHVDLPAALPRAWFLSKDGVRLVQLQHDRLTLNWRELRTDVPYPRYDELRARYDRLLDLLSACFESLDRQIPPVNLAEATYVNHVDAPAEGGVSSAYADLADIINRVRHRPEGAFLPEAEDVQLNARWRIAGEDSQEPVGRLYLSASPGLQAPQNLPIYIVNLVARVLPSTEDRDGAWAALDRAHRYVVLGFKDITTEQAHRLWGLEERPG